MGEGTSRRTNARRSRFGVRGVAVTVAMLAATQGMSTPWALAGSHPAAVAVQVSPATPAAPALAAITGWHAAGDGGRIVLAQSAQIVPGVGRTVVQDVSRRSGGKSWAELLGNIANPAGYFQSGATFRMSFRLRDVSASGRSVGLLLANGNWKHQPTSASVYAGFRDSGWHTVVRTFTVTAPAYSDTSLYFSLPVTGAFHYQIADAQIIKVSATPRSRQMAPTRTISFAGSAGSAPNSSLWNYETGGNGWGNQELQTYTSSRDNSYLDGSGHLVLRARNQLTTGADGIARQYTSARLTTQGKLTVSPGSYVEANLLVPAGQGVFPAFWLVGANIRSAGWPACGEIDVMEATGADSSSIYNALHMADASNPRRDLPYAWAQGGSKVSVSPARDTRAHAYGVYFDGYRVDFYVDRKLQMSYFASDAKASGRTWPFAQAQYIILNIAISNTARPAVSGNLTKSMAVGPISVWSHGLPF